VNAASRLRLTALVVVLGCLASMAISYRAWVSVGSFGRWFPLVPFLRELPPLSAPWDVAHVGLVVMVLIACAVWSENRGLKFLAMAATASLVMFDQTRFQPWLYQYMMMLGVLACTRAEYAPDERFALGSLRLIVASIYIFSGLHKINYGFVYESAPWLLKPLRSLLPESIPINWMCWLMPGAEIALGLLLAWPGARKPGVILAIAMHLSILLLLGPFGLDYNEVVWPWNLAMMVIVFVLFWPGRAPSAPARSTRGKARRQAKGAVVAPQEPSGAASTARMLAIVLASVVPVGGLLGWIDVYLSWGMYPGPPPAAAVRMNDETIARLPDGLRRHVVTRAKTEKGIIIYDWSLDELRVAYPEERVYLRVAKELGRYSNRPEDMIYIVVRPPTRWSKQRVLITTPVTALR
jgi:uncharacterized membrane protein YphA (DoxX/SURF4 family)